MNEDNTLKVYCDGGARGNPGPAAAAFLILKNGKEIYHDSKFLGITTNNEAEYSAVLLAVSWILKNKTEDITKIIFYLDSQLAQRQLSGIYKVKEERLKTFVFKINKIKKEINKEIIFFHVSRDKNKVADKIVNETIDENL
jgi:ribonuclease HI